ncbi:MAG: arsenate reductase family protein [Planctomycetota bacterium]
MPLPSSPDQVTLLHNPRCSKSRALKAALEERGVEFTERLYLEAPLSREELGELQKRLGASASALVRSKEPEYAQAGLSAASTDDELLAAVAGHPKLMERPVLIRGDRAAIGRPTPDAALGLI